MGLAGCASLRPSTPDIIAAFEARAEACAHWSGEEPYDAARAAEIARATDAARCTTLLTDGARLRRANRSDPGVTARIDAALTPFTGPG